MRDFSCRPTAHAEIQAIRMGLSKNEELSLPWCNFIVKLGLFYVCRSMIHARIDRVVYAAHGT